MALVARSAEGRGSAGGECGPSCNGNPLPSHHSGLLVDSLQLETQCFSCEFLVELPVSHLGGKKSIADYSTPQGDPTETPLQSANARLAKICPKGPLSTHKLPTSMSSFHFSSCIAMFSQYGRRPKDRWMRSRHPYRTNAQCPSTNPVIGAAKI